MQDLKLLHLEVENQVLQLAEKHRQLKEDYKILKQKYKDSKGTIVILENKVKTQREELAKCRLTAMLNKGGENTDVKLKINELVREIDMCIKLLNE